MDFADECQPLETSESKAAPNAVTLPPMAGSFDYQLGCAYAVPEGVSVVERDRSAPAAPGVYNICYVNAFQTQPGSDWSGERDRLILRDARGTKVRDPDWDDEYVLDISTADKRAQLVEIVGAWISGCAASGFDAVELDNLDTFSRFDGLSVQAAVAYTSELVAVAHQSSLAVAQKNAAEESARFRALGFDFVVAEQCWEFEGDCEQYTTQYDRVFDVEYDAEAFAQGCRAERPPVPLLRDVDLVAPGAHYVRRECP